MKRAAPQTIKQKVIGYLLAVAALPCTDCQQIRTHYANKAKARTAMSTVYTKNSQYLQKNPRSSRSIQIKVQSNMMIATIKLETFDNELALLKSKIDKGCAKCP